MAKNAKSKTEKKADSADTGEKTFQIPLPTVQVLLDTRNDLQRFLIQTGMKVVDAMLQEDLTALCGERYRHQEDRRAYRHGSEVGLMTLGGQKVRVKKPRVRSVTGEELHLESWESFEKEDPMSRRVLEQVCVGVPMRSYERSLEPPADLETVATKKSSVSRRFVAKSQAVCDEFLGRSLEGMDLPILMLDGTYLGKHLLVVALGIDSEGRKHVLGIREGSKESGEFCKSLLRDLIHRGLEVEVPRIFIIDGSKGLRSAIESVFHGWCRIQRCQIHKLRNVREHLPEGRRAWVTTRLRAAFKHSDAEKGRRRAQGLIQDLQTDHPGAASSIEEGLSEMFTLARLGLDSEEALWSSLRSTNAIESLQGSMKHTAKNVKRWRNGTMVLRWAVTGVLEAQKKLRRVKGYKRIPSLIDTLRAQLESERNSDELMKEPKAA